MEEHIFEACHKNDEKRVKELLDSGIDVNIRSNMYGDTAVSLASDQGHYETVYILLKAGADINAMSKHSFTPIYNACYMGHSDIVWLLLANGADMNKGRMEGRFTCSQIASRRGHTEVVKILEIHQSNIEKKQCLLQYLLMDKFLF